MDEQKGQFNNADNLRPMANETGGDAPIRSEYTVEERDTIEDIEKKHGISWSEIREANRDLMGEAEELQPGMRLKIPTKS
jgi:hypothetical protein